MPKKTKEWQEGARDLRDWFEDEGRCVSCNRLSALYYDGKCYCPSCMILAMRRRDDYEGIEVVEELYGRDST